MTCPCTWIKKIAQMQFNSSALAGRKMRCLILHTAVHLLSHNRNLIRNHLITPIKNDIGSILSQISRFTYLNSKKQAKNQAPRSKTSLHVLTACKYVVSSHVLFLYSAWEFFWNIILVKTCISSVCFLPGKTLPTATHTLAVCQQKLVCQ